MEDRLAARRTHRRQDDSDDQFDHSELGKSSQDTIDPHGQAEIMRVYMNQKRKAAPESFERLQEDDLPLQDFPPDTMPTPRDHTKHGDAASSQTFYQTSSQKDSFPFPSSQFEGQLLSVASKLPHQQHHSRTGHAQTGLQFGSQRSNEIVVSALNADQMRSPWLSQQKSSVPKSSFCLSMSLSASSFRGNTGFKTKLEQMTPLTEHQELCSQRASEMTSEVADSASIVLDPNGADLFAQSRSQARASDCLISPKMAIESDSRPHELVNGILSSNESDEDAQPEKHAVLWGQMQAKKSTDEEAKVNLIIDGSDQKVSPEPHDYYAQVDMSLARGIKHDLACHNNTNIASNDEGSLEVADYFNNEDCGGIGSGLFSASVKKEASPTDSVAESKGFKTQSHTNEKEHQPSDQEALEALSPQSVKNLSRNNSPQIAQIRTMMEAHAKTQCFTNRRTLKRMTSVQKPSNSPMLLASAASQSASSPASGGQTYQKADRLLEQQQRSGFHLESHESMLSQGQLFKAFRSTSTVEVIKRSTLPALLSSTHPNEKGSEKRSQASLQNGRNTFLGQTKPLPQQMENASSCSLMLSKSAASTVKEKVKEHLRNNKAKLSRDSSIQQILGSFLSNGNITNPVSGSGAPVVTQSSLTGGGLRYTMQTVNGPDGASMVSGQGSILHQFITEGIEEDADDNSCKIPIVSGVSVGRLSSSVEVSQIDSAERANIEKQILSNSESLVAATAIVATGGSCTPTDVKDTVTGPLDSDKLVFSSNPLQKVPSSILTQRGDNLASMSRIISKQLLGGANTGKSNLSNSSKRKAGQEEMGLRLEAIQMSDGSRRPVITPECYGLLVRDDEIQRVVSQVRKMEEESGEGTNQPCRFEIERTDSLEFTRNSATNDADDSPRRAMLSQKSGSSRGRHHDQEAHLDRTKSQVSSMVVSKRFADSLPRRVHELNRVQDFQKESFQDHLGELEAIDQTPVNQIFASQHSLTSEHEHEEHLDGRMNEASHSVESSQDETLEDVQERSITSSQYDSSKAVILQEGSLKVSTNPRTTSSPTRLENSEAIRNVMLLSKASSSGMFFAVPELPHASSKVFDEGDMPIPAKFSRQRTSKASLREKTIPSAAKLLARKPDISTISESAMSHEEALERSRVKDHVNRFIRQSQDLGTSLGLIADQSSTLLHKVRHHPMASASVKHSMVGRNVKGLSPLKGQSEDDRLRLISFQEQQDKIEVHTVAHNPRNQHVSSVLSGLPDTEVYSGQAEPTYGLRSHMHSHVQNSLGVRNPQQRHSPLKELSAISYKESHFNMGAHYGTAHLSQEEGKSQAISGVNLNRMSYDELVSSQGGLEHNSSGIAEQPLNYDSMPQKSINFVPEALCSSSEAYIKYSHEHRHRMNAGTTFQHVIQEFGRRNYFDQFQSQASARQSDFHPRQGASEDSQIDPATSQSTNYGQYRNQAFACEYPDTFPQGTRKYQLPESSYGQPVDQAASDDSAAEYDCADEAMDGPNSVCIDDVILEKNRARVQRMEIQKPTLSQTDNHHEAEDREPQSAVRLPDFEFDKKVSSKTPHSLKRLLFASPSQNQPQVIVPSTTRAVHKASSFQQPPSSQASTKNRNYSVSPSKEAATKLIPVSPQKKQPNLTFSVQAAAATTKEQKHPVYGLGEQRSRTYSSPFSEYQISKQVTPANAEAQQTYNQNMPQGRAAQKGGHASEQKSNVAMSTIVESLISIDNQQQTVSYGNETSQQNPMNLHTLASGSEAVTPAYINERALKNLPEHRNLQTATRHVVGSQEQLYRHAPVSPHKVQIVGQGRNQSGFRHIQSLNQLISSDFKEGASLNTSSQKDLYAAQNQLPVLSAEEEYFHFMNPVGGKMIAGHPPLKQKQSTRTVQSLNSSRQPTTKKELEANNFMQRSLSNGSSATRKPFSQDSQGGLLTERCSQNRHRGADRLSLQFADVSSRFIGVHDQMSRQPAANRSGNNTSAIVTPRRFEQEAMRQQRKAPHLLINDPMASETAEQLNEVELEGRGFTDSQQLSLDSDMNHFFGDQKVPLKQESRLIMQGPPSEGLHNQQNSLLFRTQANLATQRRCEELSSCQNCTQNATTAPRRRKQNNFSYEETSLDHKSPSRQPSSGAGQTSTDRRKKSGTQSAFQKAIKMTQYLMSEIERMQQSTEQRAGLVINEHAMAEILAQNFGDENDTDESPEDK